MKKNIQILIGCLIYVIGINFFLAPAGIFTTGLMGMAQEITATINYLFTLGFKNTDNIFILVQTIIYWTLNIPILIFAFYKIGKKFTIKTFIVSSVVMQILFNIVHTNKLLITDSGVQNLSSDIISVIIGSILIGIGIGLILKNHTTAGGTDIIAVYLSLYKGKSFGLQNLLVNLVIVVWAIILTQDITSGILILMSLYIQSYVIDYVYNYNSKTTMMVFTTKPKEVGSEILKANRTYTLIDGESGYSKNSISIILIIMNSEEIEKYNKLILEIDNQAFLSTLKTDKIKGNFKNIYTNDL